MTRARTVHRCRECGATTLKWAGRCPLCGAWNCLVEEAVPQTPAGTGGGPLVALSAVDGLVEPPVPTGVGELDRVLDGGLVPGAVTLLGGEPGIGKSTLVLQAVAGLAASGQRCLVVAAEESAAQVASRARRLGIAMGDVLVLADSSLPHIVATIEREAPHVCVVDSLQTIADPASGSAMGSVVQVRECAHRLTQIAKQRVMSTLLVGHVTKDGALAGPRVVEHLVDTVLSFEGERHHSLRLLRAVKHRFGPAGELGLFEMADAGLKAVPDASGLLLQDRRSDVAGSVVVPVIEGRRPLLVEVQALVAPSPYRVPSRSTQGVDGGRLSLLLAVLQRYGGVGLQRHDVFVSAVGGVKVGEPAADLAVALSIASVVVGSPLPADTVVFGEVGLGGELRQVRDSERRLAEAARLGFRRAIVPASVSQRCAGLAVERVATLAQAIDVAGYRRVVSLEERRRQRAACRPGVADRKRR